MLVSWQRFFLLFWLVLLQGVSPLLHAHVLGQVVQGGVHMHVLENERASAVPYWHEAKAHDGAEIGVAQAGRQDNSSLWPPVQAAAASVFVASTSALPALLPVSVWATPPPGDAVQLTPPSQAPPARSV